MMLERMGRSRWAKQAAGAAVIAGVIAAVTFGWALPSYVRRRLSNYASARGLSISVDEVGLGFVEVDLHHLRVTAPDGSLSFTTNLVQIAPTWEDASLSVSVRGGNVSVKGTASSLKEKWGGPRTEGQTSDPPKSATSIEATGLDVAWDMGEGSRVHLAGVHVTRTPPVMTVSFESASLEGTQGAVDAFEGRAALRGAKAESFTARRVELRWLGGHDDPHADGSPPDPAPPAAAGPLTDAPMDGPSEPSPPTHDSTEGPSSKLARLFAPGAANDLKQRLGRLAQRLSVALAPKAEAHIDDLRLSLRVGRQGLVFGPGAADGRRDDDALSGEFRIEKAEGSAGLSVRARIPLGEGPATLSLSGGPVPLPLLDRWSGAGASPSKAARLWGVVDLSIDRTAAVKADLLARSLTIDHPAITSGALVDVDLGLLAKASVNERGEWLIEESSFRIGDLRVGLSGSYSPGDSLGRGDFQAQLESVACNRILESLPGAVLPTLEGARLEGTFSGRARFAFNEQSLDKLVLDTHLEPHCAFTEIPIALSRERLRSSFSHRIILADGTVSDRTTGPADPSWAPIAAMSPYMQAAVVTSEDGGFFKHHGISTGAIRGAIAANLKARRFVRGASTISMQLAKNLFLSREKTLARKLEELFITAYLEQVLSKEEILETYLNVVEFGPDVYGIRAAAEHYFNVSPSQLSVAQSFFLASILPSPARYHAMYDTGAVGPRWRKYIDRLMTRAEKIGLLSAAEAQLGLAEVITFAKADHEEAFRPAEERRGPVRRPTREVSDEWNGP